MKWKANLPKRVQLRASVECAGTLWLDHCYRVILGTFVGPRYKAGGAGRVGRASLAHRACLWPTLTLCAAPAPWLALVPPEEVALSLAVSSRASNARWPTRRTPR